MVNHNHWRCRRGMKEAAQWNISYQGYSSHSPCPLRDSGAKPTLWSATECDIFNHFHRSGVGIHPNATWEFLGLIRSCLNIYIVYYTCRVLASIWAILKSIRTECRGVVLSHWKLIFISLHAREGIPEVFDLISINPTSNQHPLYYVVCLSVCIV